MIPGLDLEKVVQKCARGCSKLDLQLNMFKNSDHFRKMMPNDETSARDVGGSSVSQKMLKWGGAETGAGFVHG